MTAKTTIKTADDATEAEQILFSVEVLFSSLLFSICVCVCAVGAKLKAHNK